MKKKFVILTSYDVLGLVFLGSLVFIALKKDITVYHDFNLEINDTITYDYYNLNRGIEIVSIGKKTNNFNLLDKHGNAITNEELWDNFERYGRNNANETDSMQATHLDSLIIDGSPKIAIDNLMTTIGFHYNGDSNPRWVTTTKFVLLLKYVLVAILLILIRWFLQLTLVGEILSTKGTNVFKYLFILSVLWVVCEYSGNELIFRNLIQESNLPVIYGTNGRSMSITITKNYELYKLYYYIVFIVVTFFLYLAFKYGQKVKSENDLTV